MNLVFIHGPPASGKLTVARELARLTGLGVFHNHLVVDALTPVFEFGSVPFKRLREQLWLKVFEEAARNDLSLIFTFAPEATVSTSFPQNAVETVQSAGGKVLFVRLTCAARELERRLEGASRSGFGKLRSLPVFRELASSGAFDYPELPSSGLTIDTERTEPGTAAELIREFFALTRGG